MKKQRCGSPPPRNVTSLLLLRCHSSVRAIVYAKEWRNALLGRTWASPAGHPCQSLVSRIPSGNPGTGLKEAGMGATAGESLATLGGFTSLPLPPHTVASLFGGVL